MRKSLPNQRFIWVIIATVFFQFQLFAQGDDRSFPGWTVGELEIHHIYTGRGEASFLIFPDGTTLLVDSGDWDPTPGEAMLPPLPNASRRAGEWVARYIKRFSPTKEVVDYFLATHFDSDHIGSAEKGMGLTENRNPNYMLSGVAQTGEFIHFKKIIDRDYPTYRFPIPYDKLSFRPDFENYKRYVDWVSKKRGTKVERFIVGSNEQLRLVNTPHEYPSFSIRNLVGNGVLWRGENEGVDSLYNHEYQPYNEVFNENTMSLGFLLSYGPFTYFAAGDLSGNVNGADGSDIGIEGEAAKVCSSVHIAKANHHAYLDAMTEKFVRNIQAKQFVVPVWEQHHIQPATIQRMALTDSKIFFTGFPDKKRQEYAAAPWMKNVAQTAGHVVVKVEKGGTAYRIYVLDASTEEMPVRMVYGPYTL